MNEKGFISVTVIIVLIVAILIALLTMENIINGNMLNKMKEVKIQSEISSKNKMFLAAYDEEYWNENLLKILNEKFRKREFTTIFGNIYIRDEYLTENEEIKNVDYSYDHIKREITMKSRSKIDRNISAYKGFFSIINPIFLYNQGSYIIDNKDLEYMKISIEELNNKNFINEQLDYLIFEGEHVLYLEKDVHEDISIMDGEKNYFPSRDIYLIIKDETKKSLLKIVNSLEEYSILNLNGIIFIEGDLYIETDFIFDGIIIVNGDVVVKEGSLVDINGYLCCKKSSGEINYSYDGITLFGKFGTYIPNFFDLRLKSIRSD